LTGLALCEALYVSNCVGAVFSFAFRASLFFLIQKEKEVNMEDKVLIKVFCISIWILSINLPTQIHNSCQIGVYLKQ